MSTYDQLQGFESCLGVAPKNTGKLIELMLRMTDAYAFSVSCEDGEWRATFGPMYEGSGDTFDEAVIAAAESFFSK